ncbi:MAG: hypothetical protein PHX18_01495 [Candidatus Gastranaerophilales bacterium]|nr:hypothetical protein [Candidatus Gastranaerophilales bacterium]
MKTLAINNNLNILKSSPNGINSLEYEKRRNFAGCSQAMFKERDYKNDLITHKSDYTSLECVKKLNSSATKSTNISFGGFFNSRFFLKGLEFAADNGALFGAGAALVATCAFRPAAIMATPGIEKENKQYASAESVASGIIGFLIMAVLSIPLATAIKKVNKNPAKYLKPETIKALSEKGDLIKSSKYKFSTQLFKLGADFVSAIPKAMLTIALLPAIMVSIFGEHTVNRIKNKKNNVFKDQNVYLKSAVSMSGSHIFKNFQKEAK